MNTLKKLFSKIEQMDLTLIFKTFVEIWLFAFTLIILKVALEVTGFWGLLLFASASIYCWNIIKRVFKATLDIIDKIID